MLKNVLNNQVHALVDLLLTHKNVNLQLLLIMLKLTQLSLN